MPATRAPRAAGPFGCRTRRLLGSSLIRVPLGVLFIRVPYSFGTPKPDANYDNYPYNIIGLYSKEFMHKSSWLVRLVRWILCHDRLKIHLGAHGPPLLSWLKPPRVNYRIRCLSDYYRDLSCLAYLWLVGNGGLLLPFFHSLLSNGRLGVSQRFPLNPKQVF